MTAASGVSRYIDKDRKKTRVRAQLPGRVSDLPESGQTGPIVKGEDAPTKVPLTMAT